MIRKLLQQLLTKPLTWINENMAGSPKKEMVFRSLDQLYKECCNPKSSRIKMVEVNLEATSMIIFSDQHKGNCSWADDFNICKTNYNSALTHYHQNGFTFINLGDSEELWKFKLSEILTFHEDAFKCEAAFHPHRYYKTYGNHDLIWKNKLDVELHLKKHFSMPLPVYEGIVLRATGNDYPLDILLTHGHQGDVMSDNNAFSTWLVAHIWTPLQRYLRINPNSPRNDFSLRNNHNKFMYEWSSEQSNLLLVTGHTHQPVFASGRYYDHPSNKIETDKLREVLQPSYFNSGCCCLNDGDITGIEIADGNISLIKWYDEENKSKKKVLETISIKKLAEDLANGKQNHSKT